MKPRRSKPKELSDPERRELLRALEHGGGGYIVAEKRHVTVHSDDELREAFEDWARDAREWQPTDYAYQRFIRGLEGDELTEGLREAEEREDENRLLADLLEYEIRDEDNAIFLSVPREERRELIERSGVLKLWQCCWRCGARTIPPDSTAHVCEDCTCRCRACNCEATDAQA
jgi:hypothetical protein